MFVFLDIGFTMIGGPSVGPAGWLMRQLDLPPEAKKNLQAWLFNTPLTGPDTLADQLSQTFDRDPASTRAVVAGFWEQQIQDAYELPGARAFLASLEAERIPHAFITNIWTPFLLGFARVFPEVYERVPIFASCRLGIAKPNEAIYQHALDAAGVWPEEAVMIGDTFAMDIQPAKRLGIKTIWLLHRPDKEREDLVALLNGERARPDLTLAGIDALQVDHLRSMFA
ncbi:MAG: HAD-IA family hydrolase [Magnetococcales bacterium]|nr:HAD-IA family hydrolase [Magnetococcales bacterium]